MNKSLIIISTAMLLTACHTTKNVTTTPQSSTTTQTPDNKAALNYVRQVSDNAVYAKNITSSVDVTITADGKDISVAGKLQMRRDDVIRITLTPFGLMEAGRIEFTPDGVLLVNRINKEYVKATYADLDFLKDNGLDFYSLQSLFWNELFLAGQQQLSDSDLTLFTTDMTQVGTRDITRTHNDLTFNWTTEVANAHITRADIIYRKGTRQESTASFLYDSFTSLGSKMFPARETLTFNSTQTAGKKLQMDIQMSRLSTDDKWESRTTLSSRYKQISANDALSKIFSKM